MACGRMVITDRLHKDTLLDTLFTDGEDIIYYDDILDCAGKIAYYNQHTEERKHIAWNGYQKVMQNHTQVQRVDLIIEQWKNYQSV
jgi:spore maturation protein CgeB